MKNLSMKQLRNKIALLEQEIAQQKYNTHYYYDIFHQRLTSPKSFLTAAISGFAFGLVLPLRKAHHTLRRHARQATNSHPFFKQFSYLLSFLPIFSSLKKFFKKQTVTDTAQYIANA